MTKVMTVDVVKNDKDNYTVQAEVLLDDELDAGDVARLMARAAWDIIQQQVFDRMAVDLKAHGVTDEELQEFKDHMDIVIKDQADVFAGGLLEALFLPAQAIDLEKKDGIDATTERFREVISWVKALAEMVQNGTLQSRIDEETKQTEE